MELLPCPSNLDRQDDDQYSALSRCPVGMDRGLRHSPRLRDRRISLRHVPRAMADTAEVRSIGTDPQTILAWYRQYAVQANAPRSQVLARTRRSDPGRATILSGFRPWWMTATLAPMRSSTRPLACRVDSLILRSLEHAPQIQAIRAVGPVEETRIIEAAAEFDWIAFLEARYQDHSDAIADLLTTDAEIGRFRDHVLSNTVGVRRRLRRGGDIEVSQQTGCRDKEPESAPMFSQTRGSDDRSGFGACG